MSKVSSVNFAGSLCCFEYNTSSTFGNIWKWKLDAFTCHNHLNEKHVCRFYLKNQHLQLPEIISKLYEVQDGFFLRQVFKLNDGGLLWRNIRKKNAEVSLSYYVNSNWDEVVLLEDHTSSAGNVAFEYLCHIFPGFGINLNLLTFHGVLLEYNGKGIIISAPSGTGKTTHARLWRDKKNALIINGDRATCRKTNGIWTGYGLPWSGTSGEQINRSVPINIMVILERGDYNHAEQIAGMDAFGAALEHVLKPEWDINLSEKALDLLVDFLQDIPVVRLQCLPNEESVNVLLRILERLK